MRVLSKAVLGLALPLSLLFACNAPVTPEPPPTSIAIEPTQTPTRVRETPTPTTIPNTPTAVLEITLITPTFTPTYPPLPTPLPSPTGIAASIALSTTTGATTPRATSVPRASELGSSAADAALVAILRQCWNISDTRLLNGNNPAHRNAFDCARSPLLGMVKTYPSYPLVHRVLAWGYFYKDNNSANAIAEYRAAVTLYKAQSNKSGESEARMRLALLLVSSSQSQGCAELALAGNVDPTNDRAIDYYNAFDCRNVANQTSGGQAVAPPPAAPQVDLGQIHGKILFKSDREGGLSYFVMDADGKNVKRVSSSTYSAAKQWESWSPDKAMAATVRSAGFTKKFGYDNDIWITDPSGGSGRPLTNPANDYDPAWSPVGLFDGRAWLAFVSNRGDLDHPDNLGEEIWIMHDDGTSPFRVTCHGPFPSKHPTWSPDSSQLAFHSDWPNNHSQIYVMNMLPFGTLQDNCQLGENPVNLSNSQFNDTEPIWVK